jgi:hypothetical protein
MLLMKLTSIPKDSRSAYCIWKGQIYQFLICDWGCSRWSGQGSNATHVFSDVGLAHSSMRIEEWSQGADPVVGVALRELQSAFGFRLKIAQNFLHPGHATECYQAPDCKRQFQIGQGSEQRKFDQAGDIWAVGACIARLIAAPWFKDAGQNKTKALRAWKMNLHEYSRMAYESSQAASQLTVKRQKVADGANNLGSARAVAAAAAAAVAAGPDCSNRPPELWLQTMASRYYEADAGRFMTHRINGEHGARWRLLLDAVQQMLSWTSEDRLEFAAVALRHAYFDRR